MKPLEQWILDALTEYEAWFRQASPSAKYQPKVFAKFGGTHPIARRPFRHRGHWSVRCHGVARLVLPQRDADGNIYFQLDYGPLP